MNAATKLVVDWVALLEQLHAKDLGTRVIAQHIGLSHSMLVEYRQGVKSPTHANGERLIAFWTMCTGKQRDDLPMCEQLPSTRSLR